MSRCPPAKAFETAHVTIRCNNKEFLFGLSENFSVMVSWVNSLAMMYDIEVHHVLFMSNHIHMLITPTKNNIGDGMSYFLTNLSKFLNYRLKRKNHIFGVRYRATIIESDRHLMNAIRYIYQNPIRAGMVSRLQDYKYSSLGQYLGYSNHGFMLIPDPYTANLFSDGVDGYCDWLSMLEMVLFDQDVDLMKHSLTKRRFKFTRRQLFGLQEMETSLVL